MFQLKAPRKIVSTVQLWVSVALIVLALVFSMMPIISFDLSMPEIGLGEDGFEVDAGQADFRETVEEMIAELIGRPVEIPDQVNVSLPSLIGSVSLIFKVVGAAGDGEDAAQKQAEEISTLQKAFSVTFSPSGTMKISRIRKAVPPFLRYCNCWADTEMPSSTTGAVSPR